MDGTLMKKALEGARKLLTHPRRYSPLRLSRLFWMGMTGRDPSIERGARSDEPVSVVICCVEKDIDIVALAIEGARRHLMHPIQEILLVGPDSSDALRAASLQMKCVFVDERSVLKARLQDIDFRANGKNRSGWILQQLIKLSADTFAGSKSILILDADTVLIKDQIFVTGGRYILNCSREHHEEYFEIYRRLTGFKPRSPFSFVSHHMLLRAEVLRELRAHIARGSDRRWYEVIMSSLNRNDESPFSEYELYGNYLLERYPSNVQMAHWKNKALPKRQPVQPIAELEQRYGGRFKSLSFHSYNQ